MNADRPLKKKNVIWITKELESNQFQVAKWIILQELFFQDYILKTR